MDNLSQSSFKSSASHTGFAKPNKVYMDGDVFDGEYLTKAVTTSSKIIIYTPENIKPKVSGDKLSAIRFLSIFDATTRTQQQKESLIFVAKVFKQRNNYDSNGMQTPIIGYGTYNLQNDRWQLDSQFFEVDSAYPITIQLYTMDRTNPNNLIEYVVPQDNQSFIYYDLQTTYNFL